MELKDILKHLESPQEVLAVPLMEDLIDWTTFWIHQLESEITDLDFILDERLAQLLGTAGSVAAAEVQLHLEENYRERKRKENTLKSLKSYRANIRKKRDRIIGH